MTNYFEKFINTLSNNGWSKLFKSAAEHLPDEVSRINSTLTSLDQSGKKWYPSPENVFRAFSKSDINDTKVIIIGQDPYHTPGSANGLSFGYNCKVFPNVKKKIIEDKGLEVFDSDLTVTMPPSLRNIFKELCFEYNCYSISIPTNLDYWSEQGVLLINTSLTVSEGLAGSHANIGWDNILGYVMRDFYSARDLQTGSVTLVWGNHASKFVGSLWPSLNCLGRNVVLKSSHPSPFSANRGFFGCNHFKMTNEHLEKLSLTPIDWIGENIVVDDFLRNLEVKYGKL